MLLKLRKINILSNAVTIIGKKITFCLYSTSSGIKAVKIYNNCDVNKKLIFQENKNKSIDGLTMLMVKLISGVL